MNANKKKHTDFDFFYDIESGENLCSTELKLYLEKKECHIIDILIPDRIKNRKTRTKVKLIELVFEMFGWK
jgi:hypothetical protein